MEVNLSAVQCQQGKLAENLLSTMKKFGIPSGLINFEITETGTVASKSTLMENMLRLTERGSTFSLDDFGKGDSNLVSLIDMPVAILKLDFVLTKSYAANEKARHVIRNIVALAHSLGLEVVAEGVGTEEGLESFRATGVDYIQGFFFAKPMPQDKYLAFINEQHQREGIEEKL